MHVAAFEGNEVVVALASLYCDISIVSTQEHFRIPAGSTALDVAEAASNTDALICLKFRTATKVDDLIGPPTRNEAKYYLIEVR